MYYGKNDVFLSGSNLLPFMHREDKIFLNIEFILPSKTSTLRINKDMSKY